MVKAATMTDTVSSRSTAQSAERTQAIIQQSDDLVPVNPVTTPFQSDLFSENRELEELRQSRWLETEGLISQPNAQEEQPLHHTEATRLQQRTPDALRHPLRPATTFQDAFASEGHNPDSLFEGSAGSCGVPRDFPRLFFTRARVVFLRDNTEF